MDKEVHQQQPQLQRVVQVQHRALPLWAIWAQTTMPEQAVAALNGDRQAQTACKVAYKAAYR